MRLSVWTIIRSGEWEICVSQIQNKTKISRALSTTLAIFQVASSLKERVVMLDLEEHSVVSV